MMYRQALVLVLVLLTGCVSKIVEAEKKQDKATLDQAASAEAGIDDTKCQSYGYKRGTPAYVQCRKEFQEVHKSLGINLE